MDALFAYFPATDFSLLAVVMGMPLLGAFVNGLWGKRLGKEAVRLMALAAVGASFAAAVLSFLALDHHVGQSASKAMVHGHEVVSHAHVKLSWTAWEWMRATSGRETTVPIDLKFSVDALSGVMMLVITGVGFLIHLYASSYMANDKGYWRFFAYLNLFVFSMLVLVLGDNLPVLFVGWEGVGLCSYLLIGFWFDKDANASAGKKAFIANRIGDFGLLCAMGLLLFYTGALDWTGIASNATALLNPTPAQQVHVWPMGGGQFTGFLSFLQPNVPFTILPATAVGLALFLGCTGKSAQMPLYVWLPDAMAGPTPVSALIHAATMVTAGVYLVCRMSFVFALSPFVMATIAVTGAFTALLAATIALVQNDIKKVLAYSTVSQLGFMFVGVGVGAFTAGFFHVFTHAFFKACLFLGAGSVIHAMHARIHDDDASQDMRNMGGLRKYMPLTFWTFGASTLAIIGFPLTAGFFSKDEILFRAFVNRPVNPFAEKLAQRGVAVWEYPTWLGPVLYATLVVAATLTAFYMSRAFILTFLGDFRGWTIGRPSMIAAAAHGHADDAGHGDEHEDDHHPHEDLTTPGLPPHESPWAMTVPLIVLGTFALFAGFLNPGLLKGLLHLQEIPLDHWLDPLFASVQPAIQVLPSPEEAHHKELVLALGGFSAFLVGTGGAYWVYVAQKGEPARALATKLAPLHRLLLDKWRVDELYDATVLSGVDALADVSASVDRGVVDGILAKLTALVVAALGTLLRIVQNGVIHVYAAMMTLGLALVGWFFVVPHAEFQVREVAQGDYVLTAAPGLGYGYRWSADATKPSASEQGFAGTSELKVHLDPDKTQTVRLEVQNVFGFQAKREVPLTRPKAPTKPIEVGQN